MIRRVLLRALAFVTLVVAGASLVVVVPSSAQASTDPVVISPDGVTWSDSLSQSLFAGAMITPGSSVTRSFWVKNQTSMPGNLAVALRGVTGGDPNLVAALTISATTVSATGSTIPLTAANPCVPLFSGVGLAGGSAMRVDVRLTLASSLGGQTSQGSVGSFLIPVTLTSTDLSPAPTGCVTTTPVDPTSNPVGGGGNPGNPGTIGTVVISGAADGIVLPTLTEGALSGISGKGAVRSLAVIPNTGRFWQEFDITGYLVAMALGGIFAWWRRRRPQEEEAYA